MDGNHFDRLTRELARGATCRGVIKGLAGVAGAGLLASLEIDRAGSIGSMRLRFVALHPAAVRPATGDAQAP